MALDDSAVLAVATGHFYTADVDTPLPADLGTIESTTWTDLGHTSADDIIAFDSEGGDATVLATLQNSALRTTYSPRVESFQINAEQFDVDTLKLYYGSNSVVDGTTGAVQVAKDPAPTKKAFLMVLQDGVNRFAIHAPKADILRADNLSIDQVGALASLPLKVTPLVSGANTYPYQVTPISAVA